MKEMLPPSQLNPTGRAGAKRPGETIRPNTVTRSSPDANPPQRRKQPADLRVRGRRGSEVRGKAPESGLVAPRRARQSWLARAILRGPARS